MRSNSINKSSGFTIIELTLAMTFLAFVLVFSTTIIVQLTQTYTKGLTIKQINQAGRSVTDDLSRSLQVSSVGTVNLDRVANGYICVGKSAYIWNPLYQNNSSNFLPDTYNLGGEPITLARVESDLIGNCTGTVPANITPDVSNTSLLSGNARVINATATRSTADPRLVNVRFILGTYDRSETAAINSGDTDEIFNTVYYDGSDYTCRTDRLGNFCAFAEFATTVYVSR